MSTAQSSQAATIGLALLCVILGAGLVFIAGDAAWGLVAGVQNRIPTLTVSTGSAAGLPAGVALVIVAALVLQPEATRRRQRALFRMILICLPVTIILPVAVVVLADMTLPGFGYQRCERPTTGFRYLAIEWTRGGVECGNG